jgi:hypothetical protein
LLSPWTGEEELARLQHDAATGQIDWEAVALCANRNSLAADLYWAVERQGLAVEMPATFHDYLKEIYQFNLTRNTLQTRQLLDIIGLLNRAAVTPIVLKGGAALLTKLYPDPGLRFMVDLDLLVPEERMEPSVAALMAAGYEVPEQYAKALANYRNTNHYPPLYREGESSAVELHHRLFEHEVDFLDTSALWLRSCACSDSLPEGLSASRLSPTDELLYCFAHSELHHGFHDRELIDVRHLYEFSYLCRRYRQEIDWHSIAAVMDHPTYGQALRAYLHLGKELFFVDLPLLMEQDRQAIDHFQKLATVHGGWQRRKKLAGLFLDNLRQTFSAANLHAVYPEREESLCRLRFRHVGTLLRRYSRLDAWREKLRRLLPF